MQILVESVSNSPNPKEGEGEKKDPQINYAIWIFGILTTIQHIKDKIEYYVTSDPSNLQMVTKKMITDAAHLRDMTIAILIPVDAEIRDTITSSLKQFVIAIGDFIKGVQGLQVLNLVASMEQLTIATVMKAKTFLDHMKAILV